MPKFMDLTGQKFGDWTALEYKGSSRWLCVNSDNITKEIHSYELRNHYANGRKPKGTMPKGFLHETFENWYVEEYLGGGFWKCICKCGNISKVNSYDLKNGHSTMCKDCRSMKQLKKDLTGKKFGLWEVKYYAGNMRWHCVCSCDEHTEKDILGRNLIDGFSKSCGCDRNRHIIKKDISGKTFGFLEVVGYSGSDQMWECRCKACNRPDTVLIFRDSLVSGKTKSCGCIKEKLRKETLYNRYGDTNTTRINKPRSYWQISILENKDNLAEYISSFEYKPTAFELSIKLDVHDATVLKALRRFDLMDMIQEVDAGTSAMEQQLLNFVKKFGYNVIERDKNVLSGRELDIYIPEKKIAIEFNGTYWHSSAFKDTCYHQQKTIDCIIKGIQLIHVFEYEWLDDIKRQKILDYLDYKLGDNTKINGRDTYIKIIDNLEAKEFCNTYHIQGGVNCKVNIGCYFKDKLIGVMTFGKPRFDNDNEYELIRLCWKHDYNVVGGTEKMFKFFVRSYNPDTIISYCDLTKFSGDTYLKLGFKTSKEMLTKPNYVWVNPHTSDVLTRYQTQKHKLVEYGLGTEDETEDIIMSNNGYMKIYNSGNMKFLWNKLCN